MNFKLTEELRMLRDTVARFVREELIPLESTVTLQHDAAITAFEQSYRQKFDWLFGYQR